MRAAAKNPKKFVKAPLVPFKPGESSCFEAVDSSSIRVPASFLLKGSPPRDPQSQTARLANHFIQQNRGILGNFGISGTLDYDGNNVDIILKTGTRIGAIPLLSPTSGKPDYGMVIKPRYDWPGIGSMLGKMGWRVIPSTLKLPLLPHSDRKIPPWVLSTTVLFRIKALIDSLDRRFEFTESYLEAPRGTVNWAHYATACVPTARFLHVPCRYPDLRDDRELKAAIHYTLLKQLTSLESQRTAGIVVLQLINFCQLLLERVRNVSPLQPSSITFNSWYRAPLRTEVFRNGLQAMEWSNDERGLAGLGDLQGIPWVMAMEEFFEAWVETVVSELAKRSGGVLRTGRKRETVSPLVWDPPFTGSQKYLLPDVILERVSPSDHSEEVIIFDAKYKGHWEEFNYDKWSNLDDELRERHRADLLQVLAYSTLFDSKRVTSCLMYPCKKQTWESLKKRGLIYHRASLNAGKRNVNLVLTAIPMEGNIEEVIKGLISAVV